MKSDPYAMSTEAGYIKEEIPDQYRLMEDYGDLNQLNPSVSTIKEEQFSEVNHFQLNFAENNSFIQDSKEDYGDLNQLNPSVSTIKEEQFSEVNHFQLNFAENNSFIQDSKELGALVYEHRPKLEVKEEPIIEESSCSETDDEDWLEDYRYQGDNLSTQKFCSDQLPFQCRFCNYVFGVKSSFINHEKICKNSLNLSTGTETKHNSAKGMGYQFVCCEELFTVFQLFNAHKYSVHKIEFLVCGLCGKEEETTLSLHEHYVVDHFDGYRTLLEYQQQHSTKRNTTNPQVKSSKKLEEECTAAQEGILCQCAACDKKVSKDTPASHPDNRERPYKCPVCNFRFHYKCRLMDHMITHSGSKQYPCDICAQSFTDPTTVKHHKLTQHNSAPSPFKVSCNICSKEMASKSALSKHISNVHLKLNRGIKCPCPYCPKIFACKKGLTRHVQMVHLKSSQYICDYCNKVFYLKERLAHHIQLEHLNQGPVKCDVCGHTVKTDGALRAHKIKKHSNETFSCEICGKITNTKQSLKQHLITHTDERPFVCQTCGKTFKREVNLIQHQRSHSKERPHVCDICGQSFRLRTHVKQHMAVHGIGDNHKCSLCNKCFARKKELNVHMSGHKGPT